MRISDFAVKNYQFTLVIFLMTVAVGITTFLNMPRSEDPVIEAPQFPVIVIYPGASPEDMEELVVNPLEEVIYGLENIKKIKTEIKDGVAVLFVEYNYNEDVNEKYQELVREVNTLRPDLPEDIFSIRINKVRPSDVNILQIALISENASRDLLKKYGERLQEELEKITELKKVALFGLPDQIVRVDLKLDKIAEMNIPLNAIIGSIQSELSNIPGGQVEAGSKTFNVKTSGNYTSAEEISETIVFSRQGKTIQLKDVADVKNDFEETKHITRLNGYRSIFVTAALKEGNNISTVQEKYQLAIAKVKSELPENIDLITAFDQANYVNRRLSGLGIDFLIAIGLVFITLLPLGNRASIIVMISIPLSLAIGLILLNALGFGLNQLSIVGLVVALGLLVDDSIVVVENIERWIRDGFSKKEAAMKATKQISLSVVGCTVTLIIAFLPLVFLPEGSGDFVRSLPMAVIMSVLASMLVSLTIIPFLSTWFLKDKDASHTNKVFDLFQRGIQATYAPLLERALRKPIQTLLIALVIFSASMGLFPVIGFSLFPPSEKPQFLINITTPLQSNLNTTNEVTREVEAELRLIPELMNFATNVGKGNPRIYYNEIPENERPDYAQIFVQLDPETSPPRKMEVIAALKSRFASITGAKVEVKNFEQGPPVTAPVEVRLSGENLDTLRNLAAKVELLIKETQGTIYVNNPVSNLKTDVRVAIQKEKARQLGVNIVDIDRTVRLALTGLNLGSFTDPIGQKRDILLTSSRAEKATLANLDGVYITNQLGTGVPLSQIATLELESSTLTIDHFDKVRSVSVSAFVDQNFLSDRVISEVMKKMEAVSLPVGYSYKMGGEYESRQESFAGFNTVIIITVFLFIAVLILLFKTFKSTIIVLSVIPLGMVGALTALWITGNSLSFVAIIGLIALAGIEVKTSILLVDFTNQLRLEGKQLDTAIREAGEIRFLPIVLTTITAIGGLIPIALSTNPLISPLAIVLIGGLISSTLLSRIVTPVMYKLLPPKI
ncbi:MAG: efflux RND transporter permease subunit [Algoriphagus sp.]|uniref:efflux RND transporter permease subunit n=1 Tax=Algoriphagus sp. TaxID=1872435 RepID=UPI002731F74C|nr:efflux RND transporter permease subunit [Algoriphagus sp.]MDP2043134.1 efflux RND transporter permease subunit [Algoriphagus sp.]MDP3474112.1 efflux RND transporter permease subunit [Algoriphagus sp.]